MHSRSQLYTHAAEYPRVFLKSQLQFLGCLMLASYGERHNTHVKFSLSLFHGHSFKSFCLLRCHHMEVIWDIVCTRRQWEEMYYLYLQRPPDQTFSSRYWQGPGPNRTNRTGQNFLTAKCCSGSSGKSDDTGLHGERVLYTWRTPSGHCSHCWG